MIVTIPENATPSTKDAISVILMTTDGKVIERAGCDVHVILP